ncbi:DUF2304 domain-containing protein [Quadrisphaera sp. INWT6]|uniref:DUF2304 domain-containing protein n=1 Tax=Quadrisphaera sp. INWT6 TaxID=2596917 RepID=UPI0019D68BAE|nr:DUF2304 domain-containing protein [Quadrisphaera sp. INWT6]
MESVLIKVLLMAGIGVVALLFVRGHSTARHQAVRRVMVVAFAGLATASLLFPQTWQSAAELLGVGRGTDLLLYATILVVLGFMVTSYLRTRDLQRQVTVLSRRLALDEAAAAQHQAAQAALAAQAAAAPVVAQAPVAPVAQVPPTPVVVDEGPVFAALPAPRPGRWT